MSENRHVRQQKLIDCIPDNGTTKTVAELTDELRAYYTNPGVQDKGISTKVRRDIYILQSLYKDVLLIDGGQIGKTKKKSITVRWQDKGRPLNRVALSTAQMIAFATIKKMGSHLLPRHMEDSLAVFMNASANEAISQSAELNPNAGEKQNRSAAQKWLNKIQSVPERIEFIEPDINPKIEETVHRALMEESALDIKYKDNTSWKTISPLGIAQQGSRTYLIGKYPKSLTATTLLLARIREVRPSTSRYEEPEGFKLDTFLKKGIAAPNTMFLDEKQYGKSIKLKLWVNADTKWLKETPLSRDQWTQACDPGKPDGDFHLSATVAMTEGLVWWLLSMSYHVKVLEPQHLIKRLQHDLSKAAETYSN